MPWTVKDVDRHKKGLTDEEKETWVKIANSALTSCLEKDGEQEECEGRAIRIANSKVGEMKSDQLQFTVNQIAAVRREKVDGVEYLVAPCVAIREGVLNGEYVPADEIDNHFSAWNGRPFVIGHPKDEDGNDVSANDPETLARYSIGKLFNVRFDGDALKGEIWVEARKAERINQGREVLKRLEGGQPLEISTAYFRDREETAGTFRGQRYEAVARNLGPDHLAALLDAQGACSWQDGCGAPRVNVAGKARTPTYKGTSGSAWTAPSLDDYLAAYPGDKPETKKVEDLPAAVKRWIAGHSLLGDPGADNFRDLSFFPVVGTDGKLYAGAVRAVLGGRGAQAKIPGGAKSSAQAVARRLLEKEFKMDTNILRNAVKIITDALNINIGGEDMSKEEMVALVVAALGLTEEQANALEEDVLTQLSAHAEGLQAQENDDDELQEQEEPAGEIEEPQANEQPCAQEITALVEALKEVGGADKAAALLRGLKANEDARKQSLVAALKADAACAFSKERLAQMSVEDLETLQRSLKPADYGGRGSGAVYNVRDANPLKMPDIFAKPEVN